MHFVSIIPMESIFVAICLGFCSLALFFVYWRKNEVRRDELLAYCHLTIHCPEPNGQTAESTG